LGGRSKVPSIGMLRIPRKAGFLIGGSAQPANVLSCTRKAHSQTSRSRCTIKGGQLAKVFRKRKAGEFHALAAQEWRAGVTAFSRRTGLFCRRAAVISERYALRNIIPCQQQNIQNACCYGQNRNSAMSTSAPRLGARMRYDASSVTGICTVSPPRSTVTTIRSPG
jgi:hypothetical protein